MAAIDFIKSFKNFAKWAALLFAVIFLFALLLKRPENSFKNKNSSGLVSKPGVKSKIKAKPVKADSKYLKDIFNLPGKKDKKFNRPFVRRVKMQSVAINSLGGGKVDGGGLSGFIKKLKFKGFSDRNPLPPSLVFTDGRIALIKIGGKKYYVHSGENIKGMLILRIGLSDISYSDKGKIKRLSF